MPRVFLGAGCLVAVVANAQQPAPLPAMKAPGPIKCDCNVDAPAWKGAPTVTGFVDTSHGNRATDQTVARVLYDADNIYVLVQCTDANPDGIVARETVRDSLFNQQNMGPFATNEDYVVVVLDPFGSHQYSDMDFFGVNPLGTRSAMIAGGRAAKAEWSGDWKAAAKKTSTGWVCQFQIPWKLIHYPGGGKTANIGFDVARFQYRTQLLSMWSNIGSQYFWDRIGQWAGVQPPSSGFKHTLSALPYVRGGLVTGQVAGKFGVDARYLITPELTAVGSINPDFSTIEAAIQTIQFSHTEIYLPDYRPFFTEGGNDFYAGTNNLSIGSFFYSPRIQSFNVGGKLYGKLTSKDTIGALAVQGPDGRNDTAARFKHVFNSTTFGGASVVGTNAGGGQNTVGEVDQHFRFGKLGVEGLAASSNGPGAGGGAQEIDASYLDKKMASFVAASEVSSNFIAPDGYFAYTGYKGVTAYENYGDDWRHGFWRNFNLGGGGTSFMTLEGGRFDNGVSLYAAIETRSDIHLEFDYTSDYQLGTDDNTLGLNMVYGVTNRFRQFSLQATTGETGGVHSTFFGPAASLRLFQGFDVTYAAGIQNRAGVTQQHVLTINDQLSPTRSAGGRAVVNNADTNVYLFYHKSGGKGTEYYLLFGDPNAARTVRGFQVKVVFALQR
ncbi:MAG: sugar-binding protein [Fimbriimonadaceae bacterium]